MILLYHRVSSVLPDPWRLNVTASRFAEHLAVLRKDFTPVTLAEWVELAAAGRVPGLATGGMAGQEGDKPPVAVTFDDGYADNFELAAPLLEEFEIPATFFVVSGALSGAVEFWWDELERIVLLPKALPDVLELTAGGREDRWLLDGAGDRYDPEAHAGWAASEPPPTVRHRLYLDLWQILYRARPRDRDALLAQLRAWAEVDVAPRPTHRPMRAEEVREMAGHDLFTIGAHTATHPSLAALPPEEQRSEIEGSRDALAELLGHPVEEFSYPYGGADDFSAETVELVVGAGFRRACMAIDTMFPADFDPLRLPRLYVQNWTGGELRERLLRGSAGLGA